MKNRYKKMSKLILCFLIIIMILSCQYNSDNVRNRSNENGKSTEQFNAAGQTGKKIIGYYTSWSTYIRNYQVTDIPVQKLTHINYAFANISDEGIIMLGDAFADKDKMFPGDEWDQPLKGNFNQLNKLKELNPHLKTLISIGGWTWSAKFSDVALNDSSRNKFTASCIEFIREYGFDGVDIDWEYPVEGGLAGNINRPEDKQNFTLLMKELRVQLDAAGNIDGKDYLLTAATTAFHGIENLELDKLALYVDWINIMTYDFHGNWENVTNHNAPLYSNPDDPDSSNLNLNSDHSVIQYLNGGIPAEKLVFGLPFYGRGWKGVGSQNNGLFQNSTGIPKGTWDDGASGNTGMFGFTDIKNNYEPVYNKYFDNYSKVPWIYNSSEGIMIGYDDENSIGLKCDYLMNKGLSGAMIWELSYDIDNDLLNVVYSKLSGSSSSSSINSSSSSSDTSISSSSTTSFSSSLNSSSSSTVDEIIAEYKISDDWKTGFVANITIYNNTNTILDNWTIDWKYSGNQTITNYWNVDLVQIGKNITTKNNPDTNKVPANGSYTFGFQGAYSGINEVPILTINGEQQSSSFSISSSSSIISSASSSIATSSSLSSNSSSIAISSSSSTSSSSSNDTSSESSSSSTSYITISAPFSYDGSGEYYWKIESIPNFINSWSLELLEINDIDFNNGWQSSVNLPEKQNGFYYIHYKGGFTWSHFEVK